MITDLLAENIAQIILFYFIYSHSLLATKLLSRVQAEFGVELSVKDLFISPTVSAMSKRIDGQLRVSPTVERAPTPEPRLDLMKEVETHDQIIFKFVPCWKIVLVCHKCKQKCSCWTLCKGIRISVLKKVWETYDKVIFNLHTHLFKSTNRTTRILF